MSTPTPTIDDIARIVHELTIATRDTTTRPHTNHLQPPLLEQLRLMITSDGTTGSKRKLGFEREQINTTALDLYTTITDQTAVLYQQTTEHDPTRLSTEQHLITWYVQLALAAADHTLNDQQLVTAFERVDGFRTAILDLQYPPERRDWPGQCPECLWSHITIPTPDGNIRKATLRELVRPWRSQTAVGCRKCGALWSTIDELTWLRATLGLREPTPEELAELAILPATDDTTTPHDTPTDATRPADDRKRLLP